MKWAVPAVGTGIGGKNFAEITWILLVLAQILLVLLSHPRQLIFNCVQLARGDAD